MFQIWRIEGAGFELSMLIAVEFGQFFCLWAPGMPVLMLSSLL